MTGRDGKGDRRERRQAPDRVGRELDRAILMAKPIIDAIGEGLASDEWCRQVDVASAPIAALVEKIDRAVARAAAGRWVKLRAMAWDEGHPMVAVVSN